MSNEQAKSILLEFMEKIIQLSSEAIEILTLQDKTNFYEQLSTTKLSVEEYQKNPFQYREIAVSDCTNIAYRLSIELFNANFFELSEKLAFTSYQLADSSDWRERSLGALKQALLSSVSSPKWDDLDRLKSRVKQRMRKLLSLKGNVDRLPNGIDLNRLTDDVVWKSWEKMWNSTPDDDVRRNLLRKNLRFGWNYTFTVPNNPLKHHFREISRNYLAGDIASRIAIGEIEAEWIDLFSYEESKRIADWDLSSDYNEIIQTIQDIAERRIQLLSNSFERWLEWWRPLKTIRETDKDAFELFREGQQILFEETDLGDAVEKFRSAFELAPDDLGVKEWYAYALILSQENLSEKDYSVPERLLQQVIASKRQDFATIINLASIYVRTDQLEAAYDLLCPMELYERNTHRRSYVAAVLGLMLRNQVEHEVPSRIEMLESVEWLPVGLYLSIQNNLPDITERLLQRFINEASVVVGKKGSELSDINDPLVSPAQLDKDFAYFQEEGLIQEGIQHFKERAEKYHWFWANWHHLGNLAEIAGDIQLAKEAFFKRALTTAQSKASKKSKQENWCSYLDFCIKYSLFDDIEQGLEYAKMEGVPNQKLNKYLRILHLRNQSVQFSVNQVYLEKLSKGEVDTEAFIESSAERGILAFELPQPVAPQLEWQVSPIPNWTGKLNLVATNHQDPLRKEIAVEWESDDGSIPLGIRLFSTDGRYDFIMKLYRTANRETSYPTVNNISLLDLFPEVLMKARRHITSGIPGDVLVFEAPAGFGADVCLNNLQTEAKTLSHPYVFLSSPTGTLDLINIISWLREFSHQLGIEDFEPIENYDLLYQKVETIKKWVKHNFSHKKRIVVLLTSFAQGWDTEQQAEPIGHFLDICLKLTECAEFAWFIATEDLYEIRRKFAHPFWRSLQIVHLPSLNQEQVNTIIEEITSDIYAISQRAKELLFELSGGVYQIVIEILKSIFTEFHETFQTRMVASHVIIHGNQFAANTTLFSKWGMLLLPSHRYAFELLDRLSNGLYEDENSPDVIYLKDIGIVETRDQKLQIITPLYLPQSIQSLKKSTFLTNEKKSPSVIVIDHENLFTKLKDRSTQSGLHWDDKDPSTFLKIAERLIEWVEPQFTQVCQPISLATWDVEPYVFHIRPYQSLGYSTLIPSCASTTSSDLKLYLEIGKILSIHPQIETLVFLYGDGDYSMLAKWLSQQGKQVKFFSFIEGISLSFHSIPNVDFYNIQEVFQL
ncbi:MAG: hypothetical protein N2450_01455 [bacterium]|nr:hypothetical protein [bacterium]